jgi:hypothetical protein
MRVALRVERVQSIEQSRDREGGARLVADRQVAELHA